jgi:inositol-pentakisphosphate 2-kinase
VRCTRQLGCGPRSQPRPQLAHHQATTALKRPLPPRFLPSPMPALPSTSATVVSDWAYVAEGGATLVLRYVGGPHPVFSRSVLRLRKRPRGAPDELDGVEGGVDASVYGGEDTNEDDVGPLLVSFQADVVAPLLPPDTVGTMRLVPVNPHWLVAVAAAVEPARPAARRDVDEVDIALRTAVLAPDLIGAAGVVVEIKVRVLLSFNASLCSRRYSRSGASCRHPSRSRSKRGS